jgi:hypothetical protein
MADDIPGIKHITMTCLIDKCDHEAFVQAVVVREPDLQKKIDDRANTKLREALDKAHKDGQHDGR